MPAIRPPAIAGTFYPADKDKLNAMVGQFLQDACDQHKKFSGKSPVPKAIIVPHAGYRYSGAIAAKGYARVAASADEIKRVVLFGPAHKVAIKGLGVPSVDAFETPLGKVQLDQEYLNILKAQPYTEVSDAAHAEEHSLEIQLPLMQKLLGDFRLTPVVVGGTDSETTEKALELLWGGPETLIVISSDLSHYHPYQESQQLDNAASMSIMTLQSDRLRSKDACGWRAVNGLLRRARKLDLKPATIDVKNSGDTASSHDRVVGYGTWAFTENLDTTDMPLQEQHKKELIRVAGATVLRAASGKPFPKVEVGTFDPVLQLPGASFVTLTRNGRLRGCLGSLKSYRPLVFDVADRGYVSTIKDPRFPPVQQGELPGMGMEIAVLRPPKPMRFAGETNLLNQLRPGIDGLIIEDQGKRATFLPKVWDEIREAPLFLTRLKQKAGLEANHWSDTFRAWRYETDKFNTVFTGK